MTMEPSSSNQAGQPYHYNASQPNPQQPQPGRPDDNGSLHTYSLGSVSRPYVAHGWIEQALPHGAKYYVNPRHLVTVTSIVEMAGSAPEGYEMWVRLGEGPAPTA
jgi:hypothetical protein